jgi:hypothetical protein
VKGEISQNNFRFIAGYKQSLISAEMQPVFANFICKDSDNHGIFAIFVAKISIVYQITHHHIKQ